jgi:hypothetical protein
VPEFLISPPLLRVPALCLPIHRDTSAVIIPSISYISTFHGHWQAQAASAEASDPVRSDFELARARSEARDLALVGSGPKPVQ